MDLIVVVGGDGMPIGSRRLEKRRKTNFNFGRHREGQVDRVSLCSAGRV